MKNKKTTNSGTKTTEMFDTLVAAINAETQSAGLGDENIFSNDISLELELGNSLSEDIETKAPNKHDLAKAAIETAANISAPMRDLIDYNLNDVGNAERLRQMFGEDIRYCHELKKWLIWNGVVWQPDEDGEIFRRAVSTIKMFHAQATGNYNEALAMLDARPKDALLKEQVEIAKSVLSFAQKSGFVNRITCMTEAAGNDCYIATQQLDRNHSLITCKNGTIELDTATLRTAERQDFITMSARVEYDSLAKAPTFENFLRTIFDNNTELIEFVQRALGYSLTGLTREQCFFICYGIGCNGKSTLFDIINCILEDYCEYIPINVLLDNEKRSGEASPELARARGKRIVFATESKDSSYLNEAMIKTLTGGEKINVRLLHTNGITYKPTYKIWLSTNHKPNIKGTDTGIWRRVKLIPFDVTIPEADQDKGLLDKLKSEAAGIFAWLIDGAYKYLQDGLQEPQTIKDATNSYRAEMDTLADMMNECIELAENEHIQASVLYDVYKKYCEAANNYVLSQTSFGRRLVDKGFNKKREGQGIAYLGIRLTAFGEKLIQSPANNNYTK